MKGESYGVLVGEDRLRAYSTLREMWDEASASGPLRLVVVRGAAGSGRTTMLQSLYRHCAMKQARPRYWPADLSTDGPMAGRPELEELYPDPVTPEERSRLGLFWWGLRGRAGECSAMNGLGQISVHLDGLVAAVRQADELTQTRLRAAADAVSLFGPVLSLPAGAVNALSWFAVGKDGLAVSGEIHRAFQTRTGLIDKARRVSAGRELSVGTHAAALEAAENSAQMLAVIAGIIPLSIVVDDAEVLDDVTVAMLKVISRQSSTRGLIVLAINTDTPSEPPSERSAGSLTEWLEEEECAGRVSTISLESMSREELGEVAVQHLDPRESGRIDAQALGQVISASGGQPGRLVRLLDVSSVQNAVRGNGELPVDLVSFTKSSIVWQQFETLSVEARGVLATLSLPGAVTPMAWFTGPPVNTTVRSELMTAAEMDTALTTGWVKVDELGMLRFISDTAYRAAYRAVPMELTPDLQRQVMTEMAAWVEAAHRDGSWVDLLLPDVCESILTALTSERSRGYGFVSAPSWEAELIRIRLSTGRTGADNAALLRLEERLRTGIPSAVLVVATAEALFDAGHVQRALDVLQAELDRLVVKYGDEAPGTLPALANLAAARARMARDSQGYPGAHGCFQVAIGLYRTLLRGRLNSRAKNDVRTLKTRLDLARLLADAYEYEEAIREGQICVQEMGRHPEYGADHLDTLVTRNDVAIWMGEAGNPVEARDLFNALVADHIRVLGADHPQTLATRNNVAALTGRAGNPVGARDLFNALVADHIRVLGADHPNTLAARGNVADSTGQAGNLVKALDLSIVVLADRARVLGPDHPHTLSSRNNVAVLTGQTGNLVRALDLFNALLADQNRVLGPDHPHTLSSRNNVAAWTGYAGNPVGARDLFIALLTDQIRVLGADHPNTLSTRNSVAEYMGQAGNLVKALDLSIAVLADRIRVLGPDHPNTLATRGNVADLTGEAGNPARARDLSIAVLADRIRVLGPDHPHTLTARNSLALWTGYAGNPAKARGLFIALLADRIRVLGPDHPDTLATRKSVAVLKGQTG